MKDIRSPFDGSRRRPDVAWPQWTGPSLQPKRYARRAELWESAAELFPGELVLLDEAESTTDGLLLLARFLTVRMVWHAAMGEFDSFSAEIERLAALSYIDAVPSRRPERQWLRATLASVGEEGQLSQSTVSRLAAAGAAAVKRGHAHGAFALYHLAYRIAADRSWHRQAARVAKSIAAAAAAGKGARSEKLWRRRAQVHARHA